VVAASERIRAACVHCAFGDRRGHSEEPGEFRSRSHARFGASLDDWLVEDQCFIGGTLVPAWDVAHDRAASGAPRLLELA